jgi:hypothetical protein
LITLGRKKSTRRRRAGKPFYVDLSLCGLLLFLCPNGDFGRVRPSLLSDDMHAWVGREAARGYGAPASLFPLTDDELPAARPCLSIDRAALRSAALVQRAQ